MPFKKVDCKKELSDAIQDDPQLSKYVDEFKKEYALIASMVETRKKLGLTQKDVAIRSGLTQQMVSRIENVEHSPTLSNFMLYADALDLKLETTPKI